MQVWTMFKRGAAGAPIKGNKQELTVEFPDGSVVSQLSAESKDKMVSLIGKLIARQKYPSMTEPFEMTQRYVDAVKNTAKRWNIELNDEQIRAEVAAKIEEDEQIRFNGLSDKQKADFKAAVPVWDAPTKLVITADDIIEYLAVEDSKPDESTAGEGGGAPVEGVINPDAEPESKRGRKKR